MWPKFTNSRFILPLCLYFLLAMRLRGYSLIFLGFTNLCTAERSKAPPHIILIVADDLASIIFHLVVWKKSNITPWTCTFLFLFRAGMMSAFMAPTRFLHQTLTLWPTAASSCKTTTLTQFAHPAEVPWWQDIIRSTQVQKYSHFCLYILPFLCNSVPFFQACNLAFWLEPIEPVCPLSSNWCQSIWTVLATSPWLWGSGTWEAVELLTHQPGLA